MRRAVGIAALILGRAAPAAAGAGDPDRSVGTKLTGRLDLDHIGLMGHSKGGEPVSRFLELNVGRQPHVVLRDRAGHTAAVAAERFSTLRFGVRGRPTGSIELADLALQ